MSDLGFLLLFAVIALVAVWLVNCVIALLSAEHPRDTGQVWLDVVLGELRALGSLFVFIRPRWLRWTLVTLAAIAVVAVIVVSFYRK